MKSPELYNCVNEVLKDNIKARNNYNELIFGVFENLGYAKKEGGEIHIKLQFKNNFPSMETITRIARQIQNKEGRYEPNKYIQTLRKIKQNTYQKNNKSIYNYPGSQYL